MTAPATTDAATGTAAERAGQRTSANFRRLLGATTAVNLADGLTAVAVPWLATSITRNPVAIALVALCTRLPWLVLALPAGVVTDRLDRRRTIVAMDLARVVVIGAFAFVLLGVQSDLPAPDALRDGTAAAPGGAPALLALLCVAALLVGSAEVLRDNTAQTMLPAVVAPDDLQRANGRMQGAETATNQFIGPPLAGLLIGVGIAVPFFVNAGAFLLAAGLVGSLAGSFRPVGAEDVERRHWRAELGEGLRWLWHHELLRTLALLLGALNLLSSLAMAVYVLYVQEVLRLDAGSFGILLTGSAVGAIATSLVVERITARVGTRTALLGSIVGLGVCLVLTGLLSSGVLVWLVLAATGALIIVWNVITVSLRQAIIPDRVLGRVNAAYRFFGWGTISLGTALGAVVVAGGEPLFGREWALRTPFLVAAAAHLALALWALPRLTTAAFAAARAANDG